MLLISCHISYTSHLDQHNSSYDLNNQNFSSSGDCYETNFGDLIVPFDEFLGPMGFNLDTLILGRFVLLEV